MADAAPHSATAMPPNHPSIRGRRPGFLAASRTQKTGLQPAVTSQHTHLLLHRAPHTCRSAPPTPWPAQTLQVAVSPLLAAKHLREPSAAAAPPLAQRRSSTSAGRPSQAPRRHARSARRPRPAQPRWGPDWAPAPQHRAGNPRSTCCHRLLQHLPSETAAHRSPGRAPPPPPHLVAASPRGETTAPPPPSLGRALALPEAPPVAAMRGRRRGRPRRPAARVSPVSPEEGDAGVRGQSFLLHMNLS